MDELLQSADHVFGIPEHRLTLGETSFGPEMNNLLLFAERRQLTGRRDMTFASDSDRGQTGTRFPIDGSGTFCISDLTGLCQSVLRVCEGRTSGLPVISVDLHSFLRRDDLQRLFS
jgi:hypothetical protein